MPTPAGYITIGYDPRSPLEGQIEKIINKRYSLRLSLDSRDWALGRISKEAGEFEKSLKAAEARVLAFGATAGIINGVYKAFQGIVSSAYQVEKALVDINTVLGNSASNLQKFGSNLFDIAKQTGNSFNSVAETAKEFSRQGLGVEQTLKRTKDAMILARISGLDMQSSVESITSSLNSFNKAFLNSSEVVNKLAAVDQNFAVSSADLAEAIKRVGSTAEDAGVSFDELLGIVTAVQQTTSRGGAVIGNALKSIFTRISRNDTVQDLRQLGVEINNTQSGLQKLQAISQAVKLNPEIANQVKELAGGVYQINIVSAALKDLSKEYDIVSRATRISSEATNEAIARNSEMNKTLSAITNESLQNLTQLAAKIGQDTLGPSIRKYLGLFNEITDSIKEADGRGFVGFGEKVGEGILSGIGSFISGPGVAILGVIIGKLAGKFAQFASTSIAGLLSLRDSAIQSTTVLKEVNNFLSAQPKIVADVVSKAISLKDAELQILNILTRQTAQLEVQAALASAITSRIIPSSNLFRVATTPSPQGFKYKADGYIPSNSIAAKVETVAAKNAGYKAGQVKQMNIPGYGSVVYNSNEKVVNFGLGQPAIIPPQSSKAGISYKNDFIKAHGFNPYMANGMIPNFAVDYETLIESGDKIKLLGRGAFGSVFDLNRSYKGVKLGVKTFNSKYSMAKTPKNAIAEELALLKKLKGIQEGGGVNPIFNFPFGFGDEIKSAEREYFGKQIFEGKTAAQNKFLPDFVQGLVTQLFYDLNPFGIEPSDLHGGNVMPNQQLVDFYNKKSSKQLTDLAFDSLSSNKKRKKILSDIDQVGGRLNIIDIGNFIDFNGSSKYLDYFNEQAIKRTRTSSVNKDIDVLTAFLAKKGFAAKGYIPNFTLNQNNFQKAYSESTSGLISALAREAASGVGIDNIRIGSNTRLTSPNNPLGLGVYNKIDEPFGLQQGINRVMASGYNPKMSGIPNFADYKDKIELSVQSSISGVTNRRKAIEAADDAIQKFVSEIRVSLKGQEDINKFIKSLNEKYELSDSSLGKIAASLRATALYEKNRSTASQQKQLKMFSGGSVASPANYPFAFNFGGGQIPFVVGPTFPSFGHNTSNLPAASPIPINIPYDFFYYNRKGPNNVGLQPKAPTPAEIALDDKARKLRAEIDEIFNKRLQGAYQFGPTELKTELAENLKDLKKPLPPRPASKFKFNTGLAGLSRKDLSHAYDFIDPSTGKFFEQFTTPFNAVKYSGRGTTSYSPFNVFDNGQEEARRLKDLLQSSNIRPSRLSAMTNKVGNFLASPKGAAIGFGAYLGGGVIQELIGNESLSKRRAGSLVGVGVGALAGAATGAAIGGPSGALVGVLAGGAVEATKAIRGWNDVVPDLVKNFESIRQSTIQASDAASRYADSTEKLNSIYSGEVSATPQQILRLRNEQNSSLLQAGLNSDEIQRLFSSGGNLDKIGEIFSTSISRRKQEEVISERDVLLGGISKDFDKYVNFSFGKSSLTKQGKGTIESLLTGVLTSRNDKNQSLFDLIEKDYQKSMKGQPSSDIFFALKNEAGGQRNFEELKKFATSAGFDESILTQIGQLGLLAGRSGGGTAISKSLADIVTKIPDLSALSDEQKIILKRQTSQTRITDDGYLTALRNFNALNTNQRFSSENALFNLQNTNKINSQTRTSLLELNTLFSGDTVKNALELSNALAKVSEDAAEAKLELNNSLFTKVGSVIEESFTKTFDRARSNIIKSKLPFEEKNAKIAGITDELTFIKNSVEGFKSVEDIQGFIAEQSQIANAFSNQIEGLAPELAAQLEQEIDARRELIIELQNLVKGYENSSANLDKDSDAQKRVAKIISDNQKSIINQTVLSKIGGSLENFGNNSIGNQLFNLRNQANVGSLAGDTGLSVRALSGIAELYKGQGLEIPSSLVQELNKALVSNLQKQISSGQLTLKSGETAESVAFYKIQSEFGKNIGEGSNARLGLLKDVPIILDDATNEIQQQSNLFSSIEEQIGAINSASLKRIKYENDISKGTKEGLQAQRELTLEIRKQLAAQSSLAFNQGRITGDEFRRLQAEKRLATKELNGGRLSGKDLRDTFFEQFKYNTRDFYDDLETGAIEAGQTLKSSFKDAFKEATDGTKSVTEALQDMGISFLRTLGQRAFDIGVDSIFNSVFAGIGKGFGYGRANGGVVKKYAVGGKVEGGSGVRDDIPAMLSDGEYVIKKAAVNQYGIDFLDSINAGTALYDGTRGAIREGKGRVNAVFKNAYTYNDSKQPTAGNLVVDPSLTSFALDNPDNPQNQIRFDREEELGQFLLDKADYEKSKKEAYDAWRTQRRRALQAAWIQAGISAVGIGIQAGISSRAASAGTTAIAGAAGNTVVSQRYSAGVGYSQSSIGGGSKVLNSIDYSNFQTNPQSFGFSSSTNFNYANNLGGSSFGSYNFPVGYRRAGGGPAIDNVPAMLMGGEYVINKKAVDIYGKDVMDDLNSGRIKKMADGGLVGMTTANGRQTTEFSNSSSGGDLIKSVEDLRKSIDEMAKKTNNSIDSSNTSINININVDKTGTVTSSASSESSNKNRSKEDQYKEIEAQKALAKRIESVARQVIIQEKRPNGLLAD